MRYFLSFCLESEGMGEATVIQTRMHPSQQNINYKLESCWLMYAKITNGIPIYWCQYVCLLTYPPYSEVGTTWIDWCPLFYPFLIPTLITAAGWQTISILKFCNFCSRTRNHRQMEKLLSSRPARIQASKSSSNFSVRVILCKNCAFCQGLFHIFIHTRVGILTVYVQLEFQLCPYCYVTLNPVWVPNWLVNFCRLRVQLQEGLPAYSFKAEDYPAKPLYVASANTRMLTLHWLTWECVWRRGQAGPRWVGCQITVANFGHPALEVLNLQSATSTALYAARFQRWV